jgi:hypothetical protein
MNVQPSYPDQGSIRVQPCRSGGGGTDSLSVVFPTTTPFPQDIHFVPDEQTQTPRHPGTVRHKRLECGHKLVFGSEPRHRNCERCWFAFFQAHGEMTRTATEVFKEHGLGGLTQITNKTFAVNFVKFMATLAHWQKIAGGSEVKEAA